MPCLLWDPPKTMALPSWFSAAPSCSGLAARGGHASRPRRAAATAAGLDPSPWGGNQIAKSFTPDVVRFMLAHLERAKHRSSSGVRSLWRKRRCHFRCREDRKTTQAEAQGQEAQARSRGSLLLQTVHRHVHSDGRHRQHQAKRIEPFVQGNVAVHQGKHCARSHVEHRQASRYVIIGQKFARHESVNHARDEYVRGEFHSNTAEGCFSIFKRGLKGVYQHCSEKHLHRYDFRYSNRSRLGVEDAERTDRALKGIEGKRLTYRRPDETTQ